MRKDEPGAEGDCNAVRAPLTGAQSHSTKQGAGSSHPQQFQMRHLSPGSIYGVQGEETSTQEQQEVRPESELETKLQQTSEGVHPGEELPTTSVQGPVRIQRQDWRQIHLQHSSTKTKSLGLNLNRAPWLRADGVWVEGPAEADQGS